jgi:hypothetical protein
MAENARYPFFGVPPARQPRPASTEPALTGKRVVLSTEEGFVYDMRAAGELYTDGTGNLYVDVVNEPAWFDGPRCLQEQVPWPAQLVWVE